MISLPVVCGLCKRRRAVVTVPAGMYNRAIQRKKAKVSCTQCGQVQVRPVTGYELYTAHPSVRTFLRDPFGCHLDVYVAVRAELAART